MLSKQGLPQTEKHGKGSMKQKSFGISALHGMVFTSTRFRTRVRIHDLDYSCFIFALLPHRLVEIATVAVELRAHIQMLQKLCPVEGLSHVKSVET
ncbi:hypothetical protein TNCV_3294371 [Trichonephila clavipes]|nr:hypothetical protein TNCV_3294371 [Trichonephila clavipes]